MQNNLHIIIIILIDFHQISLAISRAARFYTHFYSLHYGYNYINFNVFIANDDDDEDNIYKTIRKKCSFIAIVVNKGENYRKQ